MKILIELTYYRPHTSGLTIYAERLAKALVQRGHEVTVLTSQYEKELPREEWMDGVHVVRVPVLFRISKGVIMPTLGWVTWRMVKQHDVIHLHRKSMLPASPCAVGFLENLPSSPITATCACRLEY